jgi:signal transduction histidine kinase
MAVVLAAILLTTIGLSAVWYITLRNQQIDARLDYLISEAEDIAYLASNYNDSSDIWNYFPVYGSTTGNDMVRVIMDRKADKINREFGAYIAVVDRSSNVMDNLPAAYREDPEFVASLNSEEINSALNKIIGGETIRLRSSAGPDPTFTVGVPFTRRGFIYGAVFIQTKAQRIESGLNEILLKAALLAAGVMLLSGVAVFLFVRGAMKPVRNLSAAAGAIAGGDFSPRLAEDKGGREMREVSRTFNNMTKTLADVEEGRREFVANVSHELRSPITSIRGFAEGMADGVIPPEEQPKYLRLVADESKRLSSLVDDLLALSRLEREDAKPDWSVFDINEMLRRAIIRRMDDLEKKRIEAECDPAVDPCPVRADSDRIEQVIINLLDNALKFTGEDGKIRLSSAVNGNIVEVTVWDNGPGVPPEDRDRIFDRFFTGDRAHTSGKGTGLGLSICQRIMEMHGQTIRLLDTAEGAAFRFTLEYAPDGKNLTETEKNA